MHVWKNKRLHELPPELLDTQLEQFVHQQILIHLPLYQKEELHLDGRIRGESIPHSIGSHI